MGLGRQFWFSEAERDDELFQESSHAGLGHSKPGVLVG
jgi:hypothetical protein